MPQKTFRFQLGFPGEANVGLPTSYVAAQRAMCTTAMSCPPPSRVSRVVIRRGLGGSGRPENVAKYGGGALARWLPGTVLDEDMQMRAVALAPEGQEKAGALLSFH